MMFIKKEKGPIKRPKKIAKNDGKRARQRLMGMALGLHMLNQTMTNAYFFLKAHMQAQILLLMMLPLLLPLLVVLAIPTMAICVFGMVIVGLSANLNGFNQVQVVRERRQFELVKRQSTRLLMTRDESFDALDGPRRLSRFASFTSAGAGTGSAIRRSLPQRTITVVVKPSSTPLARPSGPPRRSQTFTFGARQ